MPEARQAVSALESALEYHRSGLCVVVNHAPLPDGDCTCGNPKCGSAGKHPVELEWQLLRLNEEKISNAFKGRQRNVGIHMGTPSKDRVDIDLDAPEAVALADDFLSPTQCVFGRASKPRSHRIFIGQPLPRTEQFKDSTGAMLVEIRSDGAQTIFPGSTHVSGEVVTWDLEREPARIQGEVIRNKVARLAAASLLARHWPAEGGRQDAALALAGGLLRAGWSEEETAFFIEAVARAAGDEEAVKRGETARYTARQLAGGGPATGWPHLAGVIGDKVVAKAEHWLGMRSAPHDGFSTNGARPAEGVTDTTWPAMSPLPTGAPPVPTLPPWMVPEPLRSWVADVAQRACIPLEFVAIPALIGLSAVVGRSVGIRPSRFDDFLVVPNLWGGIIARPGAMKSHAVEQGLKPVARLAATARDRHAAAEELDGARRDRIEAETSAIKSEMTKVAKSQNGDMSELERRLVDKRQELAEATTLERRYMTQDATVEKLGELLRDNPRGLLVSRDELAGWLRIMDKSGREGDREFYLEAWNGTGSYTFDRIGRGTVHIEAVTVSICGGIQPGKLSAYMQEAIDGNGGADGLLQRLQLLVWPDGLGEWIPPERWPETAAKNLAFGIFAYLDTLEVQTIGAECEAGSIPYLRFSPEAQALFDAWRNELENRLRSQELAPTPAFESHLSKYRSLMPSLALLFHLVNISAPVADANGDQDPAEPSFGTFGIPIPSHPTEKSLAGVSLEAAQLAAAWCDFLEAHARKVYAAELYPGVDSAQALAEKIKAGQVADGLPVREIYRHHWSGLTSAASVSKALEVLSDAGWVRVESVDTGGRPTDVLRLHPELRGGGGD